MRVIHQGDSILNWRMKNEGWKSNLGLELAKGKGDVPQKGAGEARTLLEIEGLSTPWVSSSKPQRLLLHLNY